MQTYVGATDQNRTASSLEKHVGGERPSKLIECIFEVRIDGMAHDHFYDVRDAVASARPAKRNKLSAAVVVTDVRTGKLVIEVEE
jgi:hypothetical protein